MTPDVNVLVGNAIADGWIAAAVLARSECLASFDRDFTSCCRRVSWFCSNPEPG